MKDKKVEGAPKLIDMLRGGTSVDGEPKKRYECI
jgi:hypothetical protein